MAEKPVFAASGGFREDLREHEVQDMAIRLEQLGLPRYFDPSIAVRHTEVDVRGYNRLAAQLKAEASIQHEHGIGEWLRN